MKLTNWFKHDYNARNDDKVRCLIMDFGVEGYGLYFLLTEMLHENVDSQILIADLPIIAKTLCIKLERMQEILSTIYELKLMFCNDEAIYSTSVLSRKSSLNESLEKRSIAGKKGMESRWGKNNNIEIKNNNVITPNNKVITNITSHNRIDKNRIDNTRKEKINKKEIEKFPNEFETFQNVIVFYESEKRSAETEFGIFVRKHKDWKNVIPLLESAIKQQSEVWNQKNTEPQYRKKLGNWLSDRLWETFKPEPPKVVKTWAELQAEQEKQREEQRQKDYLMWQQAQTMSANVN